MEKWIQDIIDYKPYNEQEEKDKAVIMQCLDTYDNLLTRENPLAHFSSSGFIINQARDKVLMIHHNIYNEWAWTGGHTDGDSDLLAVAIREAQEETGIKEVRALSEDIFSLDVLPVNGHIKRGEYVSSHLHLSVAYLLEADETEALTIKPDENSGVKWIRIDELETYVHSKEDRLLYKKFLEKIKAHNL